MANALALRERESKFDITNRLMEKNQNIVSLVLFSSFITNEVYTIYYNIFHAYSL